MMNMTSFKSLRKLAVTLLCTMFTPLFATDGDVSMDKTPHLKSLQDVPFCSWDGWGANAVPTGNADCAWVVGEPTDIPYGDAYVINYADLSAYDRLVVTVTEGSARLLFNRDIEEGQWDENEAESHLIDNTRGGWSEKYFFSETKEDGSTVCTVDLALMVKEKGFAHLHAIKGANWENVTVTSMVLQKLTISLQDVPFCSWDGWGANATPTGYADCAWVVGEPIVVPYGDLHVINYADLSAYDRLVVAVTEGTARLLFNRDIDDGQWNENEAESHLIDNTRGGWSGKYFFTETKEDGSTVCTVDLALMVKDKGFAHLHSIKGDNFENVTVTSMVLQIIPQGQTTNTHTLTITAAGNGYVTYDDNTIRDNTSTFSVDEGTNAILKFAADEGNRVKSIKVNGMDVTSQVADDQITISNITENTNVEVVFEAILPTTYSLSITASGNGSVVYDGKNVRNNTSTFNVEGGTNAILKFSADEGNRVKSVKINNQDVTTAVVNNQYTINNVKANTKVEVVFEALPYYSLNIIASGNGSATYNGTTIRNQSQAFTIREGSSAVVSFTSDNGYRIKSVKVNSIDVTSQLIDNQITISNITKDTNVEVVFEAIPPTTYTLSISVTGYGGVTYKGTTIREKTQSFTVNEGASAFLTFVPNGGFRVGSAMLNGVDITANIVNNKYTISNIAANTTLEVAFEAIPTYSLTIKSSAFGSVKYGDAIITNKTETYSVTEGESAELTFLADGNGRLQHITLNGNDITNQLVNGQYTINDIKSNQSVEAEYTEESNKLSNAGVAYTITSFDEQTVVVSTGNYDRVLTIPATFEAKGKTWKVTGMAEDALSRANELAAIIWDPEVAFTAEVSNPNLLLYVKNPEYAPATIQNVVVNDLAENIVLVEAAEGNNFYCPKAFTAKRIIYEHNYSMITGYKTCQGWETIVLPFDVTMMVSPKGIELVPYVAWQNGTSQRPFWLYQLTSQGWKAADGIKANVPYIISMPYNELYHSSYNVMGNIRFVGNSVEVKASNEMTTSQHGYKRLVGNYQNMAANADVYVLNVSNLWCQNTIAEDEGSVFFSALRAVHPFEAYMIVEGSNAPWAIPVFDNDVPTDIIEMERMRNGENEGWYDLQGRKLQGEPKKNGIYLHNGKKIRK